MKMAYRIASATGGSLESCYYLGQRYDGDQGLVPEGMDSWVVAANPAGHQVSTARPGWMNGLWWSPGGTLYVTFEPGKVYVLRAGESEWLSSTRGGSLLGIWGLDDQHVYAWGKDGDRFVFHFWDGARWDSVEAPGEILAMHAVSPDRVFVVGALGLCAEWDGERFEVHEMPETAAFWSVAAAPDGRVWACGPRTSILELTEEGWVDAATPQVPALSLAFWNERLWVAAGQFGLFVVDEGVMTQAHKDLEPMAFDARGNLLMFGEDALAETADGESFRRVGLADFRSITAEQGPTWDVVVEEPDIQDDDDPEFADDYLEDDDDDDDDED